MKLVIEQESFNTAFVLEIGESRKLNIDTDYKGELKVIKNSRDTRKWLSLFNKEMTISQLKCTL